MKKAFPRAFPRSMPTEHGIREIIAKLGQAAKLSSPLGPHDLRHTVAKSLLDPAAYGLDGPPMPLPTIQQLLGHADIATLTPPSVFYKEE